MFNILKVGMFVVFGITLSAFGLNYTSMGYWVLMVLFTIHGIISYVEGLKSYGNQKFNIRIR